MVTRIAPDGRLTTVAAGEYRVAGGDARPGRQRVVRRIGSRRLLRVDAAGARLDGRAADRARRRDRDRPGRDRVGDSRANELVRFPPVGRADPYAADGRRGCKDTAHGPRSMARATDGAMWLVRRRCGRSGSLATARDDRQARGARDRPRRRRAPAACGSRSDFDGAPGTSTPPARQSRCSRRGATGAASRSRPTAAPGSPGDRCELMRATPAGALSFVPAPIPADLIDFDRGGRAVAGAARRGSRTTSPRASATTRRRASTSRRWVTCNHKGYGTVSLAALRKARGFRVRVTEPRHDRGLPGRRRARRIRSPAPAPSSVNRTAARCGSRSAHEAAAVRAGASAPTLTCCIDAHRQRGQRARLRRAAPGGRVRRALALTVRAAGARRRRTPRTSRRLPLGLGASSELVAGPDGGAWVAIGARRVRQRRPRRRGRRLPHTSTPRGPLSAGWRSGPDGHGVVPTPGCDRIVRIDARRADAARRAAGCRRSRRLRVRHRSRTGRLWAPTARRAARRSRASTRSARRRPVAVDARAATAGVLTSTCR